MNTLDAIIEAASKSIAARSPVEPETRKSLALRAIVNLAFAVVDDAPAASTSACLARAESFIARIRLTLAEETLRRDVERVLGGTKID